jgi:hypothetical protein
MADHGTEDRALRAVAMLRRLTVDQARAAFADSLRDEVEAARLLDEAEAALERERRAATDTDADDEVVETYIAWLERGQRSRAAAQARHTRAVAEVTTARAVLAAAQGAAEAADQTLAARRAAQRDAAERRAQAELEEQAAHPSRQRARH